MEGICRYVTGGRVDRPACERAKFPCDTQHYHGGPTLSPNITCLLWTPPTATYSAAEIQGFQDYLLGITNYLGNGAAPPGANGAGTEPVPRQYGVWGAYFGGTCRQDTTAPFQNEAVNLDDHSPTAAIPSEVNTALGSGVFSQNDLVVVFTRGWTYAPGNEFAQHWSMGTNQYLAADATDLHDYTIIGHEVIEASTDAVVGTGWFTDQNQTDVAPCAQANGGSWGDEMCDDGGGTAGVLLQTPLADGFGNSSHTFILSDAADNIDGSNATWTCGGTNTCAAVGNINQCPSGNGVRSVLSGNAFTNMTTTFPVTVVQTGTKLNVLTRTPSGLAHLVSTNNGASYTTVTPPVGTVTDTLAAYSKDGTTSTCMVAVQTGFCTTGSSTAPAGDHRPARQIHPGTALGRVRGRVARGFVWVTSNDRQIYIYIDGSGWFNANMPSGVKATSPPQTFPA